MRNFSTIAPPHSTFVIRTLGLPFRKEVTDHPESEAKVRQATFRIATLMGETPDRSAFISERCVSLLRVPRSLQTSWFARMTEMTSSEVSVLVGAVRFIAEPRGCFVYSNLNEGKTVVLVSDPLWITGEDQL